MSVPTPMPMLMRIITQSGPCWSLALKIGSITGGGSQGATIPAGKTVRKNGMIVLQEETIKTSLV
jgi:hypothetical protein